MAKNLLTEWGTVRKTGPVVFILKYGVLGWGLGFAGLFWIFVHFAEPSIVNRKFLIMLFSVSLFSGLIVGLYLWFRLEHQFKKAPEKRQA